ncbi:hypothetical protein N7G274_010141 [Stereocaulon virgatum]|uniref:Exonuclease domain-containing protein n=1 Tax=Stereocaulon virgatum TaxID=373712 RepID=A0ABR3ZU89_9LECA
MGGGRSKKRKHAQFAHDTADGSNNIGIGATLANLRVNQPPTGLDGVETKSDSEEWTTVGRGGKKQKKMNYPGLGYSELHRLQSSVNINQLQGLVLYCLADGTSPQWVSVRHHGMVQKAVVLFVPGLEKGMFDGSIELESPEEDVIDSSEDSIGQKTPAIGVEEDLIDFSEPASGGKQSSNGASRDLIDFPEPAEGVNPLANTSNSLKPARSPADTIATQNTPNITLINCSSTSPDDYLPTQLVPEKLATPLKPLASAFPYLWPIKTPGDERYGKVHSPLHAMLHSPITKTQEEKREDQQIKGPKPAREGKAWDNKRTPITEYIASKEELQDNEYILHQACFTTLDEQLAESRRRIAENQTADNGWTDTFVEKWEDGTVEDENIQKGSLTGGRNVLAMDCEMCLVQGGEMALTRISLVEWDGSVLMDEFVKPDEPIIDYLTPYSGITPAKLANVHTTLTDIQGRLIEEIKSKHILVGHSLNSDLMALKMTHPFVVDTSILYPHPRGPPMKSSLKWLAQKYLGREIQKGHGKEGHDSIEDARACLDLVKMKCERGPQWGSSGATSESIFKRLKRVRKAGTDTGKIGAIVDHGAPEKNFGHMANYCIGCKHDAEIVAGVRRAVHGDTDGSYIPGGGVDFTWARFQELAAVRGWLLDYRHSANQNSHTPEASSRSALGAVVTRTVQQIKTVRDFLPPCTLLIVYSGTGDPREMGRLQKMQRTFKREYRVKKWDELSVKWTDNEEQALKAAYRRAREGLGLLTIT